MAEETDPQSKTEDPTQKRLDDARKKGDVPKTPDLAAWASLAGVVSVLVFLGGSMARDLLFALVPFIAHPDAFDLQGTGAVAVMRMAMTAALPTIAVVMLAACVAGVAGNLVQSGLLWTGDKLKPDFKKVSPQEGFKRIYGPDGLMQFAKSLLKVLLLGVVCWIVLKPQSEAIVGLLRMEPAALLPFTAGVLKSVALWVLGVLALGALGDWFWQRHRFITRMRMSREELKEEMKQSDGDPHIKARQRQIRMERSRRRMMQNVPKATVVITNPTHFAIALRYEAGETAVPECVAKGVDKVALKIREVAADAGVPIIEDPPLARALYATVEVDEIIPQQHFEAVAKIIGFVLSAAKRRRIGVL